MSNPAKHTGGCHCGRVRYQAELDLDEPVMACNCSMCGRTGTLLQFIPPSRFTLLSGEDALQDYQFKAHNIHHLFCKTCGIKSFARGTGPSGPMVAINTRCLDDVDLSKLQVEQFDGKRM
jgi:hypothetical protein